MFGFDCPIKQLNDIPIYNNNNPAQRGESQAVVMLTAQVLQRFQRFASLRDI